jgi:hypothetical protein
MLDSILAVTAFVGFSGVIFAIVHKMRRDLAHVDDIADMRSVPLVPLQEIAEDDVVRVAGTVAPADPLLVSPVSGRRCVHYDFVVYQMINHYSCAVTLEAMGCGEMRERHTCNGKHARECIGQYYWRT